MRSVTRTCQKPRGANAFLPVVTTPTPVAAVAYTAEHSDDHPHATSTYRCDFSKIEITFIRSGEGTPTAATTATTSWPIEWFTAQTIWWTIDSGIYFYGDRPFSGTPGTRGTAGTPGNTAGPFVAPHTTPTEPSSNVIYPARVRCGVGGDPGWHGEGAKSDQKYADRA